VRNVKQRGAMAGWVGARSRGGCNASWPSFHKQRHLPAYYNCLISNLHRSQQFMLLQSKSFNHHPFTKALKSSGWHRNPFYIYKSIKGSLLWNSYTLLESFWNSSTQIVEIVQTEGRAVIIPWNRIRHADLPRHQEDVCLCGHDQVPWCRHNPDLSCVSFSLFF
jgi:hypothetical protein